MGHQLRVSAFVLASNISHIPQAPVPIQIRNTFQSHVKRYVDDNQRVYKTIPMKLPSNWRNDLNYSARSKDGRILFDALPADANGNQCAVLLLKRDDELAQEIQYFLPSFRYVAPPSTPS